MGKGLANNISISPLKNRLETGQKEALQRLYRGVVEKGVFSGNRCQSHASPQVFTQ